MWLGSAHSGEGERVREKAGKIMLRPDGEGPITPAKYGFGFKGKGKP